MDIGEGGILLEFIDKGHIFTIRHILHDLEILFPSQSFLVGSCMKLAVNEKQDKNHTVTDTVDDHTRLVSGFFAVEHE